MIIFSPSASTLSLLHGYPFMDQVQWTTEAGNLDDGGSVEDGLDTGTAVVGFVSILHANLTLIRAAVKKRIPDVQFR
jgi:hypothetical protein